MLDNLTLFMMQASEQSKARKRKLMENIVKYAGDDFVWQMVKI